MLFDPLLIVAVWASLTIAIAYYSYRKYPDNSKVIFVSDLGTNKSPRKLLFNLSLIILGLCVIYFGYRVHIWQTEDFIVDLFAFLLVVTGTSTMFTGIITLDMNKKLHDGIAMLTFGTVTIVCLLGCYLILKYFPPEMYLTLIPISLVISFLVINGSKDYLIRNHRDERISKPEWIVFILSLVYFAILSVSFTVFS